MYLQIINSDGDTYLKVTEQFPEDGALEGYHVQGLEFLAKNDDSNYWQEDTTVVIQVQDV